MLVHETTDPVSGAPRGLELAFATPRAWLQAGKTIIVQRAPTSFGPLSYTIQAVDGEIVTSLQVPSRQPLRSLRLRLRVPRGERITGVEVDGRPPRSFDPSTGTIDLSGFRGDLQIVASVR
jgi:hypothetical protein